MIKYSFVLPAYKAAFLKLAIDSILAQSYSNFELIIVNDASPDNIDSIVNAYKDSRIKYYINKANLGGRDLVSQWNLSISYASGEYLILASDDDIYDPEYLQNMNLMVDKYPLISVFRCRVQYIDESGEIINVGGALNEYTSIAEYMYLWARGWIGSGIPYHVFKRSTLLAAGGFANYPMAWFADDATILRLGQDGIVTSPKILFSFRMSRFNITAKVNSRSDLYNKIRATEMFYKEVVNTLKCFSSTGPLGEFYKNSISILLPRTLLYSRVKPQLVASTLLSVTRVLTELFRLTFASKKAIIKLYLSLVLSKFKLV